MEIKVLHFKIVLRDLGPFVQFKNCEKKTNGGVLLLVKLQAKRLQLY